MSIKGVGSKGVVVQLRIRTNDAYVHVYETRPARGSSASVLTSDEFGVSMRVYGPFATADEQRAFMRGLYEDVQALSEEALARALAVIDAWVRFDEEEGYEPPAVEPAPVAKEEPIIAEPSEDEVRAYAPAASGAILGADGLSEEQLIRRFLDGLRRVVN